MHIMCVLFSSELYCGIFESKQKKDNDVLQAK